MKMIKTALTALVMLLGTVAFAGETSNVTETVNASFTKDFAGASHVSWQKISDFYFADFKVNDKTVNAAYNEQGELVGTSRRVSKDQLPLAASLAIAKKYDGYELEPSVLELTYEGTTSYYFNVANSKQVLHLKVDANGESTVLNRKKR
jgi:hypothetical protein